MLIENENESLFPYFTKSGYYCKLEYIQEESSPVIAEQIYKSGKHTLWLVSPPLLLLCPQTPHIVVFRPRSLHLRPLTLRATHPMTHQGLWMLHTGSECTKHSTRKPTHWKRHLNGKESEYSWGLFLLFLTNSSLQKDSFHKPTWSRYTEGCFHLRWHQGLGAWSWQAHRVPWWSRCIDWWLWWPRWRTGWRVEAQVCDYLLLISFADPGVTAWPWNSWECSHKALQELCRLIPNFQKKIDQAEPEELSEYYAQVRFTMSTAFLSKQKSPSSRLVPTMHVAMTSIAFGTTWPIGWINPNCGLLLPSPKTSAIIVAFVMMLLAVFSVQPSLIGMILSTFLFLISSAVPV